MTRLSTPLVFLSALVIALLLGRMGLGSHGFWEPTELSVAAELMRKNDVSHVIEQGQLCREPSCKKNAEELAELVDRESQRNADFERAWAASSTSDGASEVDARAPSWWAYLLGLWGVLLLGFRMAGQRGAFYSAVIFLTTPALLLSAKQLLGFGLESAAVGLIFAGASYWVVPSRFRICSFDAALYGATLALGVLFGLQSAGALFGLGLPLCTASILLLGRTRQSSPGSRLDAVLTVACVVGAVLVMSLVLSEALLIGEMIPGTRHIFGLSLDVVGDYSPELGGVWKSSDQPGFYFAQAKGGMNIFDAVVFGFYPWSALLPGALLASRMRSGVVYLVVGIGLYALGAIVISEKVSIVPFLGFALCAPLVGCWLASTDNDDSGVERFQLAAILIFVTAAALARNVSSDPSLVFFSHISSEPLAFPEKLRGIQVFTVAFGVLVGVFALLRLGVSRRLLAQPPLGWIAGTSMSKVRTNLSRIIIGLGLIWGIVIAHYALPVISSKLSSKDLFARFDKLSDGSEDLLVVGSLGFGPEYYARGRYRRISSAREMLAEFKRPERIFAVSKASEMCRLLRDSGGETAVHALYYSDNATNLRKNTSKVLLSNQLKPGEHDYNPLLEFFSEKAPSKVPKPMYAKFEDGLELLGADMPSEVNAGESFTVKLYFKVYKRISRDWTVLVHIDPTSGGVRVNADHPPMKGRCPTNFWPVGQYMTETFSVTAPSQPGTYRFRTGLFYGGHGRFTNMKPTGKTQGVKALDDDRVDLGPLRVR